MTFFQSLVDAIQQTSIIEWLAFIFSIAYVIFAAKEKIICWLFAFISSALYVYLCYVGQLYVESVLQVFYVAMAIVGWQSWNNQNNNEKPIVKWKFSYHLINIAASVCLTLVLGYLLDSYTDQKNPYIDSMTTTFSLLATYMVTKKVLENWLYWVVIDIVSIYLYAQRDYNLAALQYGIYTVLAIVGYFAWIKVYKTQQK